jgi:hypothetical protein
VRSIPISSTMTRYLIPLLRSAVTGLTHTTPHVCDGFMLQKWAIRYFGPGRCGKSCLEGLHPTGQRSWHQVTRTRFRHFSYRFGVPGETRRNGVDCESMDSSHSIQHCRNRANTLVLATAALDHESFGAWRSTDCGPTVKMAKVKLSDCGGGGDGPWPRIALESVAADPAASMV